MGQAELQAPGARDAQPHAAVPSPHPSPAPTHPCRLCRDPAERDAAGLAWPQGDQPCRYIGLGGEVRPAEPTYDARPLVVSRAGNLGFVCPDPQAPLLTHRLSRCRDKKSEASRSKQHQMCSKIPPD